MSKPDGSDINLLQENFEDFFDTALCGYIIADKDGIIIRANKKIATWLNQHSDALKGKRFSDILSIGSKVYYETHLRPLFRMQSFFDEVVLELSSPTGQKLQVLVNAYERRDKNEKPCFIRYTIVKGSDRLQYEKNLKDAKAITENELSRQKEDLALRDQLIAVLGHDLRNPLSSIQMAAHMLKIDSDSENAPILNILKRSSARMAELISNIMDFARTRLGQGIVLNRQKTILEPEIQQVVDEIRLIYPKREITTFIRINKSINCDSARLAQLISNLLANALTYGEEDFPVQVHAVLCNEILEISVTNNGNPIPSHINEKLFTPFARGTDSANKSGLGIGLFISNKIAKSHNGTLSHSSTENTNTFTFRMNC